MANFKFIVNPAAARGKADKIGYKLNELCAAKGLDFDLEFTKKRGQATDLAHEAANKYECIVAVGGDGTVNEIVNGIVGKKVKLGIIPVGSGNDFVKALNIPLKLNAALDTLVALKTRFVDVGKAGTVYFHNGLGIGFDAWVVEESFKVKKLRGNAIYLYSVLRTIYGYRAPYMHCCYDNHTREEKLFMISVGNGTSMGGGFKLTPFAQLDDGLLDLTIIKDLTKWEIYQNLISVYFGKHTQMPQVTVGRTKKLEIESEEGFAAHVDGELLSLNIKSLEITIVPKSLEIVIPKL
jgi:YegS/Rv2252/BmrU family lipid kinase